MFTADVVAMFTFFILAGVSLYVSKGTAVYGGVQMTQDELMHLIDRHRQTEQAVQSMVEPQLY